MMKLKKSEKAYQSLVNQISNAFLEGQKNAVAAVNIFVGRDGDAEHGHLVMWDDPDVFQAAVTQFLLKTTTSRTPAARVRRVPTRRS